MAPPVPPPLLPHAKRCRTVAVAAASSVSLSAFLFLCLLLIDLAPHRALYPRLSTSSDLSVSPSHKVFVSPQDPVDNGNPSSSVTEASRRRDPHRTPPFPPPSRPFEPSKPADSLKATATEAHPEADSFGIKKSKTADSVQATATEAHPGAGSFGIKKCDIYQGKWERDEEGRYPLYQPASCPYVDEAYTCQENGRWDSDYLKWKWKPDGCHLPRFNGTDFLERIRGKRLMFVGDSMNRNQFESMLCLLREALPDKSKMYETRGYKITKGRGYFIFKFADYDCTVEFVRSHFLAREGVRINRLGNSNPILSIDQIDKSAKRWKRANILVFNTGHWWTHGKTARGKNYYQEGGVLYPQFDATEAYRKAIKTWGRWIDHNVDHAKQLIIYRGYSAAHFRGGDWDSGGTCKGEREPVKAGALLDSYPLKMKIVEDVINRMHVPVVLLNVTKLTNYRKDGHPSIYGKKVIEGEKRSKRRQDCSHWCLPGIPDAWNELIYATLIQQQHGQ